MNIRSDRRLRRTVLQGLALAALLGGSGYAGASEYGCQVLLCLANPASNGGPKGVSECVPPISQLYDDIDHGRPFPTCDLADGNDGSAHANLVSDPYDPCPDPLKAAANELYVVQGTKKAGKSGLTFGSSAYVLAGTPQQSGIAGMRACVGSMVGSYSDGSYDVDQHSVSVFDQVLWQRAQNPRAIDVYIDNTFQQRVRW